MFFVSITTQPTQEFVQFESVRGIALVFDVLGCMALAVVGAAASMAGADHDDTLLLVPQFLLLACLLIKWLDAIMKHAGAYAVYPELR